MQFTTIAAALLLPLLAVADSSTTTLTSTATMTKTVTLSQAVASVTATYPAGNATLPGPTAVGTTSITTGAAGTGTGGSQTTGAAPSQTSHIGAASSLNSLYAGSAGMLVMVAAAFL